MFGFIEYLPQAAMKDIKNFLLDMDGTLYLGERLFEGTVGFLDALEQTGRRRLFLTNNSSRSAAEYLKKLKSMGIPAGIDDIFISSMATIIYLKGMGAKRLYLLATGSVEQEFRTAGFELTDRDPEFVVLCFDKTLTYQKLEKACDLIQRGVKFIATHPDIVCPTEDLPIPDTGSMIKLIESVTGVSPRVIGKPNAEMAESALKKLSAAPHQTAIVGDRLYTDMEMGYRTGLTTILVLSGETKIADVRSAARRPDYVFNSVADIITEL